MSGAALLGALLLGGCQPGDLDVDSQTVAPGVVHHRVHVLTGPWWVHVLEIDLPRAWSAGTRLRTVSAPGGGVERTSVLAGDALAAVNGDFFFVQDRIRVAGLQLSDGCLRQAPQGRSAFAVTESGRPLISSFQMRAGLITAAGEELIVGGFDHAPAADGLSFYNHCCQAFHDSVRAFAGFQLQSLAASRAINDTVPARVTQVRRRAWPLSLGPGQWVVAAGPDFPGLDRVAPGDTVRFYLSLQPEDGGAAGRLLTAIGGGPRILRDGEASIEYAAERLGRAFAEERHPRTAIGYSRDGRTLFLVTVDGRQPGYSVGMSLSELAEFMAARLTDFSRSGEGACQALNLDGGGSTTMVVRQQVVNSPSDQTGERAVANALLVVSGAVAER